jgi:hypothetical protein
MRSRPLNEKLIELGMGRSFSRPRIGAALEDCSAREPAVPPVVQATGFVDSDPA